MLITIDRMRQSVVDNEWLQEREAEREALIHALEKMTNLASQWERFNGEPTSTDPEIESAKQLLAEARAGHG